MKSRREFLKTAGLAAGFAALGPGMAFGADKKRDQLKGIHIGNAGTWDVIVVGGGPGGCAAAISAAREGARTLLIEAMGQLGGMGTLGMVPAWCPFSDGEKIIYRGLAERIFNESKKGVPHEPADKLDWVNINPEYLMRVYDKMVAEAGVEVLYFSRVAAVEKSSDDELEAIIVANKLGLMAFKAKIFIDATGDGDLAAWAGAEYSKGDADGVLQSSSLCFSLANVNMEAYYNGVNIQTDDKQSPIHALADSGRYPLLSHHLCLNPVGPGVIQFNAGHIDGDTTDPKSISQAMIIGRETAEQHLQALREINPAAYGEAFVVRTAAVLGVRDSRRIIGDYVFTAKDWNDRRTFEDEIGRNSYFIDIHKVGFDPVKYGKGDSHGIPYRCLTPKGLKNMLTAGRCISTDDVAFGSLRVMPPCLVTGEAAGMAAVHAIEQSRCDVHAIDVQYLRKRLREEGQYFL